jgi:hypothetical protein
MLCYQTTANLRDLIGRISHATGASVQAPPTGKRVASVGASGVVKTRKKQHGRYNNNEQSDPFHCSPRGVFGE